MGWAVAFPLLTATELGLPAVTARRGAINLPSFANSIGGGGPGLAGAVYVVPFWAGDNLVIDAAIIGVTALAAGSSVSAVLYSMNADGYPGSLQTGAALATVSTATAGVKIMTFPQIILAQGGYWLGVMCFGGTPSLNQLIAPSGAGGSTVVPWQSLATLLGNPGQCDYSILGGIAGLGDANAAPVMPGQIDAFFLADFDNTGRTVPPDPFGAYTGRVGNPATTENATVNTTLAVALRNAL